MIILLLLIIILIIVLLFTKNSQIKSNIDRSKIINHAIKEKKITDEQISMAVYSVCMESFKNSDNQKKIIDSSYKFIDYPNNTLETTEVKNLKDSNCYIKSDLEILQENLSNVNSVNTGKNLEAKFRHVLSMCIANKLKPNEFYYRDVVGVDKYDRYAGTDFILCGKNFEIRIDITARNCNIKDNTTLVKKYKYFDLGVRCGNLVKKFDEKVLVYAIPYDNEDFIIKGMIDIYNNFEDTIKVYLNNL